MPDFASLAASESGGSPFENVAATWPLRIGAPQSSTRRIESGVGHAAGCARLFTSPVCVGTSFVGVQEEAGAAALVSAGTTRVAGDVASTISVTLTVRTAAPAKE